MDITLINKRKDREHMKKESIIYEDVVTNSGIILVKDKMYILKDGKKMRLNAFIIKQSRERN